MSTYTVNICWLIIINRHITDAHKCSHIVDRSVDSPTIIKRSSSRHVMDDVSFSTMSIAGMYHHLMSTCHPPSLPTILMKNIITNFSAQIVISAWAAKKVRRDLKKNYVKWWLICLEWKEKNWRFSPYPSLEQMREQCWQRFEQKLRAEYPPHRRSCYKRATRSSDASLYLGGVELHTIASIVPENIT